MEEGGKDQLPAHLFSMLQSPKASIPIHPATTNEQRTAKETDAGTHRWEMKAHSALPVRRRPFLYSLFFSDFLASTSAAFFSASSARVRPSPPVVLESPATTGDEARPPPVALVVCSDMDRGGRKGSKDWKGGWWLRVEEERRGGARSEVKGKDQPRGGISSQSLQVFHSSFVQDIHHGGWQET
ncbi:hypothetical protein BDY24DRAFT_376429 [Mrakia frigida]|uniref:uncharacterized protein n=1 Tax=Mrakia frigida TaxID=29902 RepID=UPI003FCC1768